jgi:5'-nucleotidase
MRSFALPSPRRIAAGAGLAVLAAGLTPIAASPANADVATKISVFPYSQNWSNADLITANDDWSGMTGIQGYLGQDITTSTGVDPQTLTGESAAANDTDVVANAAATATNGGVLEVNGDTIAIQGSGTADAPYVAFHLDLTGKTDVSFAFNARDLDASADNATQQIAVQYRVGVSGPYTNLPAGYVADATAAGTATQVTAVDVPLPVAVDNQASVFVRVMTTNAVGNDELVGIDDVVIDATAGDSPLTLINPGPQNSTVGTEIDPLAITAGGGTPPYDVRVTNLPAGLAFDADTDQVTGTPTAAGTTDVEVSVTDAADATDSDTFTWTVSEPDAPVTIAEIQGTGATSQMVGDTVTTRGVVTAVYPQGGFFGFYIQTPGTGAEDIDLTTHTASDGIFVRQPSGAVSTAKGTYVEVTGTVTEFAGATQVEVQPADIEVLSETPEPVVTTTTSDWPRNAAVKESLEGMLYRPTGDFTVTNTFSTNNFGEVGLAQGDKPLIQRTEVELPGPAGSSAVEADNNARAIVLDDGSSTNFLLTGNATQCNPRPTGCLLNGHLTPPYVSTTEPVRVGAAATFVEDVIFTQGGSPNAPTYRFQPLATVVGPDNTNSPATFEDTRTAAPDQELINGVGEADLKVASFNVLNYFTTLGDANDDNIGDGGCNPFRDREDDGSTVNNGCDQRGAWDPQDFERQQSKIVDAINALDADVVGLMEIENSTTLGETPDEATNSLVAALNAEAGAGTWAANPSSSELPASGMDVITNAIIYKPASVQRVGESRALGTLSDGDEAFSNAREPLGQVFQAEAGGDPFLFVVNHFKSKGSAGPHPGDGDNNDGQGNANVSRTLQATALKDWVAGLQIETGVESVVLAGDFNSYAMEDPLRILYDAGYTNVEQHFENGEYSYSFSGLSGSLDHILVNDAALERATGTDIWNINAGESLALEYSRWNYHATDFHAEGPYRSSDHDPVILGLTAEDEPPVVVDSTVSGAAAPMVYGQSGSVSVEVAPATATGTVTVAQGASILGSGTLNAGQATITLAAKALPVGTHTLDLAYGGDAGHKPSTGSVTVVVSKGQAAITAEVIPELVIATTTKATMVVTVAAEGYTPTGDVRITIGNKVYRVSLHNGRAAVQLKKFAKPGSYEAEISYTGDVNTDAAEAQVTVEVERP